MSSRYEQERQQGRQSNNSQRNVAGNRNSPDTYYPKSSDHSASAAATVTTVSTSTRASYIGSDSRRASIDSSPSVPARSVSAASHQQQQQRPGSPTRIDSLPSVPTRVTSRTLDQGIPRKDQEAVDGSRRSIGSRQQVLSSSASPTSAMDSLPSRPQRSTAEPASVISHEDAKEMLGGLNSYGRGGSGHTTGHQSHSSSSSSPPRPTSVVDSLPSRPQRSTAEPAPVISHNEAKEMLGGLNAYGRSGQLKAPPPTYSNHEDAKDIVGGLNAYGRDGRSLSANLKAPPPTIINHQDAKEMLGVMNSYGREGAASAAHLKAPPPTIINHQDAKEMVGSLNSYGRSNNNATISPERTKAMLSQMNCRMPAAAAAAGASNDLQGGVVPMATQGSSTRFLTHGQVKEDSATMTINAAAAAGYSLDMDDLRTKKLVAMELSSESRPGAHNHEGSIMRPARPLAVGGVQVGAIHAQGVAPISRENQHTATAAWVSPAAAVADSRDNDENEQPWWNNKWTVFAVMLITLALNASVSVGIVCGVGDCGGNNSQGTIAPTTAPPTSFRDYQGQAIRSILEQELGADYFGDTKSAALRQQALDWLVYQDEEPLEPDDNRLLQRFVLALFYFATSPIEDPWLSCGLGNEMVYNASTCAYADEKELYAQTGFYWVNLNPECVWAGISCNDDGQVTRLKLTANDIKGGIPTELAKLTHLEVLDLFANVLTGTFPTLLGELTELKILRLAENQLMGTIPEELSNLTNLKLLAVQTNALIGGMPDGLCSIKTNQSESTEPNGNRTVRFLQDFELGNPAQDEVAALDIGDELEILSDCTMYSQSKGYISCPDQCCTLCCTPVHGCLPTDD